MVELTLEEKIRDRSARIAVLGLGYVGLPIAVEYAKRGFHVLGLEVDEKKKTQIQQGQSYLLDVSSAELAPLVREGRLEASSDYDRLAEVDVIFICVPTPFAAIKTPDISYIVASAQGVAHHLQRGQLVILQSTTYPGTTEEVVLPILEASGLKAGRDFCLAFSPERVNPGDRIYTVANTPKVVGGITQTCAEQARRILSVLTPQVHLVSSTRAAEMAKLLENVFRSVNVALVNELAQLSERMGIDLWEVIEAASTKPFGFMPFYPGPGVGGHCIPVDPYYLSWKAREYDFYTKFIELAAEVNQSMPYHLLGRLVEALNAQGKPLKGSLVLVLGVAFKKDIEDARNSPAERFIELLLSAGAQVEYHDPFVPHFSVGSHPLHPANRTLESVPMGDEVLSRADCVVILTGHSLFDYQRIVDKAKLVVDSCNATAKVSSRGEKVWRLGAPPTHSELKSP